jgi:hypothetical protein
VRQAELFTWQPVSAVTGLARRWAVKIRLVIEAADADASRAVTDEILFPFM